jgi:predicted transcriptional regulator
MAIVVTLSSELETLLHDRAMQQGVGVDSVVAQLLTDALAWEAQDQAEAIQGIQRGLDDFAAGRSRSFREFAEEQRLKYDLPTET